MKNTNDIKDRLIPIMEQWQKIEDASIQSTTQIIKMNANPLIHVVMEIIRQDSAMHRRVQQLIIDHFNSKELSLEKDELEEVWDLLMEHDLMEKKTIALAKDALEEAKDTPVGYLLEYLMTDEKKHDKMIDELEKINK